METFVVTEIDNESQLIDSDSEGGTRKKEMKIM